jgi:hypothetical protein
MRKDRDTEEKGLDDEDKRTWEGEGEEKGSEDDE